MHALNNTTTMRGPRGTDEDEIDDGGYDLEDEEDLYDDTDDEEEDDDFEEDDFFEDDDEF